MKAVFFRTPAAFRKWLDKHHERHFHEPHFGYVTAGGRMRITDEAGVREVDFSTGSSFSSEGVAWHEGLNVGDGTVIFLIVEPK